MRNCSEPFRTTRLTLVPLALPNWDTWCGAFEYNVVFKAGSRLLICTERKGVRVWKEMMAVAASVRTGDRCGFPLLPTPSADERSACLQFPSG